MYLYLDLIWLLNFCIDYLLLWMTALFRQVHFKKWRLALASVIGSSYVLFLFVPPLLPLYTFTVKVVLALLIIWVAFGFESLYKFAGHFLMFYFVSFITGGGMLAVHFFMESQHDLLQGMVTTQGSGYGDAVSWWFVIIGFPVLYWFTYSRWSHLKQTKQKSGHTVRLDVYFGDERLTCPGLVDTGNSLYEPFTKTPVMIVEEGVLQGVVPHEVLDMQKEGASEGTLDTNEVEELPDADFWLSRLRMVPYRGVRQSMEMMVALKADRVCIRGEQDRWQPDRVLIGINGQPLSRDGAFQAIVHPDVVQPEHRVQHVHEKEAM
jgi:stage II sporulation protein GA (sporulation sigma-E factor processing peptidase)